MAEHQRTFRGEATPEANRALAGQAMRELDRQRDEATPAPTETKTGPAPIETKTERKQVNGRDYLMHKGADKPLLRKASPLEAEFLVLAMARVELLMSKPDTGARGQASWRQRIMAVMQTKTRAAAWQAAADAPDELATTRATCEKDQKLLKVLGLETISQLTPAFARAKAAECNAQYLAEFLELLESSNPMFGDWKEQPKKKIQG